ncbi:hypothetical protein NDU88_001874 [Pleurodeles waltl]|uniref:Uncharacterized protein n=1 Tax=Pleurodeles waltl TaxID=8319 RepID=A0AAV7LCA9_PLEWA|nr:hypothetical protein NDU88_001874 [Pleurodeles waltl]
MRGPLIHHPTSPPLSSPDLRPSSHGPSPTDVQAAWSDPPPAPASAVPTSNSARSFQLCRPSGLCSTSERQLIRAGTTSSLANSTASDHPLSAILSEDGHERPARTVEPEIRTASLFSPDWAMQPPKQAA